MDHASVWDEMKDYVGFCEQRDAALLRAVRAPVAAEMGALTDHFYATVLRFPGARAVLANDAQVQRLKTSMARFIEEMLAGPWDEAYHQRRRRIGQVHVRVGLPDRYVFTAMNLMRRDICDIVRRHHRADPDRAWDTCHAITRVTDLELAVINAAYLEAHEQAQLRSLQDLIVQNLPMTVLCLDATGLVTSATRPSSRLFGGLAEVGRHYETFLPADLIEAADLPSAVGRALATGREISIPRVSLGQGTTRRHFRVTLVPLEHELARLLIHIEELTDVVHAEARVQQAEALARIGSLAAHMAHEIRNPLAAISATLQVIVGTLPADDRRKPILGKVQEQVHRLDRLVTDLLGYARPARPTLREASVATLAREAVAQSGVPARVVLDDPGAALVDPEQVGQILMNLLQNARDAAGPGGTVVVRAGPGAQLDILDDGPGIPAEVADRLFEPFVTSKTRGTGLGLAISRKLAQAMDGCLDLLPASETWAEGRGPGAHFRLGLTPPRRAGDVAADRAPAE